MPCLLSRAQNKLAAQPQFPCTKNVLQQGNSTYVQIKRPIKAAIASCTVVCVLVRDISCKANVPTHTPLHLLPLSLQIEAASIHDDNVV